MSQSPERSSTTAGSRKRGRAEAGSAGEVGPANAAAQAPLPSANVRTIINLLLFAHLFSLGVVLFWQTNSSPVSEQLHNIPAGYLKPLHLDLAFDDGHPNAATENAAAVTIRHRDRSRRAMLHFTHADLLDNELWLEFTYEADATTHTIMLPAAGLWPPLRRERYALLAWEIARTAGEEESRVLARVVATGLMNRLNVDSGKLSVVRRAPQSPAQAVATDEAFSNPLSDEFRRIVVTYNVRRLGSSASLTVAELALTSEQSTSSGSQAPGVQEDPGANSPASDPATSDPRSEQRFTPRLGPIRQGGTP